MKTYPYWWDTVPGVWSEPFDSLTGSLHARSVDVAVIGAGYTGLSAARSLARRGASVLVVERGQIGSGASSRNGGQVVTGLKLDVATLVRFYGEARAREVFAASLDAMAALEAIITDEGIACDVERTGHVQAAAKPGHFRSLLDEQALLARVFHHDVRVIEPAGQSAELGASTYHGLLVDEHSFAINPARYVYGLAAAAVRAGATIVDRTRVSGVRRTAQGWTVTTPRGEVEAHDVVVATNGYTDEAFPALRRRLVPIGSYIIATAPLPAAVAARLIPRRRVVFDSRHFLHYFRLTPDNRLLFGGRAEFSRPTPASTRRATRILRQAMVATFPELSSTAIEYAWSGHVAFTRDQMPHAGRLDDAYFAGGYSGHGVAMATYLGTLVARRVAGERFDHPLFDDHFPPIPLYHGRPWFLPLVGLYYRFRDWIE